MHRPASTRRDTRAPLMPYRLLFPLAAIYAIVAVPLWLVLRHGNPAVTGATWHGHEMVFGFAFAVIAGFLSTRPPRAAAWILMGGWLAARLAAVTGSGPLAFIAGIVFPVTVLGLTVPPLVAGAKRNENRILPALLIALVATDVAWWAGAVWFGPQVQTRALLGSIDLIALLLLLIGGRALRAAAGGHLERQGIGRRDLVQPRYELPLAAIMGGVVLFDVFALEAGAGGLCLVAAFLVLVRAIPWQIHRTLSQPHLLALVLGYIWLVPGLALKGIAQLAGSIPVTGMLHGIGIGALGTLTLVMMARTATLRARKPVSDFRDICVAALLVSAAALSRLLASVIPTAQPGFLWLAAATWIGAFLILLARLRRTTQPARREMTDEEDT